jgi:hypothetical protein
MRNLVAIGVIADIDQAVMSTLHCHVRSGSFRCAVLFIGGLINWHTYYSIAVKSFGLLAELCPLFAEPMLQRLASLLHREFDVLRLNGRPAPV